MIPGPWPFLTKVGQAISEPVNLGGRTELAASKRAPVFKPGAKL
jgi:hypothetical protein